MCKKPVRIGQARVRLCVLRVLSYCLVEKLYRAAEPFVCSLAQMIPSLQIQIMRGQVLNAPFPFSRAAPGYFFPQLFNHRGRDFFLDSQWIAALPVHRLRLQITAARDIYHVRVDSQEVVRSADAPRDKNRGVALTDSFSRLGVYYLDLLHLHEPM